MKNGRASVHFRLLSAHACSDQVKNFPRAHVFGSRAQTAPSMSFLVSQEDFTVGETNKKVSMKLIATFAPARADIEAGVVAKADQK